MLSAFGGDPTSRRALRAAAPSRKPQSSRPNPILDWVRSQPRPYAQFLRRLGQLDRSTADSFQSTYALRPKGHRLSLTLFLEFAQAQGLAPGEAAALLDDPTNASADALDYIVQHALLEQRPMASLGSLQ